MILRRSDQAVLDGKIRDAMQKPMTAENLNYIGDLYLRKGEKELTLECFYNAIGKLHVSQREKMTAIYKKIIKVSPGDEKAYRGLIDIFSKMGLIAEEVFHLEALGKVYQSRGKYEKVNETYRRIYALDPGNEIAGKYFGKGKQTEHQQAFPEATMDAEQAALLLSGHPEIGDLSDALSSGIGEKPPAESLPEGLHDDDRTSIDRDYAEDEDLPDITVEPPAEASGATTGRRIALVLAAAVLLMFAAAGSAWLYFKKRPVSVAARPAPAVVEQQPVKALAAPDAKTEGVVIKVRPLSSEEVHKAGISGRAGSRTSAEPLFYEVSFRPAGGCIPENYFMTVRNSISFAAEDGSTVAAVVVPGLEKMSRIVYKSNVAGCGDNAPVFMKLWVAQSKGRTFRGISVKGIEKDKSEIITWE